MAGRFGERARRLYARLFTCIIGWSASVCCASWSWQAHKDQLFIDKRIDGLGETMKNMIYGMALAEKYGLSFGGMVGGGHESHSLNLTAITDELFGSTDLFPMAAPKFARVINRLNLRDPPSKTLTARLDEALAEQPGSYLIQGGDIGIQRHADKALKAAGDPQLDSLLTPSFLASLRSRWHGALERRRVKHSLAQGRPLVAVHVRRGDVQKGNHGHRLTNDRWYFDLVDQVRGHLPDADVHVFSSLEGQHYNSSFDPYRERGMTVHLDTDPLWDWAQMSSADVLVMAKSAYSHVPAFLNQGCIIYQPYWSMPLNDWIRASRRTPVTFYLPHTTDQDALGPCLDRVMKRKSHYYEMSL